MGLINLSPRQVGWQVHCQCPPKSINNWCRFLILSQVEEGPLACLHFYVQTQNDNDGVIFMGVWREICTHHVPPSLSHTHFFLHFTLSFQLPSVQSLSLFNPCHFHSFEKLLCIEKKSGKAKGTISLPMGEKQKMGFL